MVARKVNEPEKFLQSLKSESFLEDATVLFKAMEKQSNEATVNSEFLRLVHSAAETALEDEMFPLIALFGKIDDNGSILLCSLGSSFLEMKEKMAALRVGITLLAEGNPL